MVDQRSDHRGAAVQTCQRQRSDAIVIGGVYVRTGGEQEVGGFQIVPMGGPMERGGSVALGGVDVGVLLEEGRDGFGVLGFYGVDQAEVGCWGCGG